MKLTRTGFVFSKTIMVLFLCRNKSFWNHTKLFGDFYGIYKKYWSEGPLEGATSCPQGKRARPPSLGTPCYLVGPTWLCWPWSQVYKFLFLKKKQEKKLHRILRYEVVATFCSSLGGLICSSSGAPKRGSVDIIIANPSSLPIPWCSPSGVINSFVGLLDNDGVGWDLSS